MENEEEFVVEGNEEVEQTTENENTDTQTVEENVGEENTSQENGEKVFTQEELNRIVSRRVSRAEDRVKREYQEKYSKLNNTLNTALGTNSPEESANRLIEYYKEQGINIPEQPHYSEEDLRLLAKAEAESIISSGYDDLVDEVDRLANKGFNNMSLREKFLFKNLEEERERQEEIKELASIGVKEDTLSNKDFKNFADKFDKTKVSIKEIYEMYEKTIPKKEVKPIGSMKSETKEEKEFFTDEEIKKLSMDDLRNDNIWNKVRASMTRKNN